MKILIDIGHPGHIHLFNYVAKHYINNGHQVLFTTRKKEFEVELLKANGFEFICFGRHYKSLAGKLLGAVWFSALMLKTAIRFKPNVFLSHGSMYAAYVAYIMGRPHISMEDSGNMEQIKLYLPFTKVVLTPDVLIENLGIKQKRYRGYHEIAYLHPRYFNPNSEVYSWLGLQPNEKFCIIRFVSWNATHDIGQKGFTTSEKAQLVYELSKRLKVFITSEAQLPAPLASFQIKIHPNLIHHALAYAQLVVSEGATMASEAGVLGTPAIYVNSIVRCYNQDQEKYGTVYNYLTGKGVLEKSLDIIREDKDLYKQKSSYLLSEKIDVTAFIIEEIDKLM
jgi:uncharacterized protein